MKRRAMVAVVAAFALAGCQTVEPIHTPPLECEGEDQCKLYWERAQVWVAKYSYWKIQVATDVVIQTFNATQSSTYNHYSLVREPMGGGVERISMTTGCDNMFGCQVRPDVARRSLFVFVKSVDAD